MSEEAKDTPPELYRRYRPSALKHVLGQASAVKVLDTLIRNEKVPHSILFSGPSGCGKTTLARILAKQLKCHDDEYREINSADFRGIDMVRDLRLTSRMAILHGGPCRVIALDECHKLTNDAQNGILKLLEDTPPRIYFFLMTTDPNKLLAAIQTRCTEVKVKLLNSDELRRVLTRVLTLEEAVISDTVMERLIEVADGKARKALVILGQVIGLEGEEAQLDAIQSSDATAAAINIARQLLDTRTQWSELAKTIESVPDEPETVRRIVLGYMTKVMLGGGRGAARAFLIANEFREHWYDLGKNGLAMAAYSCMHS